MRRIIASVFALGLAAAAGAVPAGAADYEVSIAGAGPSSLAYNLAAGLAENTNSKTDKVRATAETSAGFVENIRLVGRGETEFGLTSGVQIDQGVNAKGPYEGEDKYTDLRGVMVTYTGNISWNASTDIQSYADLEGKTVAVGPPGSLLSYLGEQVLEAYGLVDKVEILRLSFAESARAFVDGTADAFVGGPAPYPSVMEAGAQKDIRLLEIDDEHIAKIRQNVPVTKDVVKAGIYDWLDKDVTTIGYVGYLVTHKDVPDEVVYEVLKTNLSDKGVEYLKSNHRVWSAWNTPQYIADNDAFAAEGIKLHPGAVKYWTEQGVEVSAALKP